ncbi:Uncharacterised protein [Vibrio cholerae]|nr:Uncharacterised protein [Vibrio cholerae]
MRKAESLHLFAVRVALDRSNAHPVNGCLVRQLH